MSLFILFSSSYLIFKTYSIVVSLTSLTPKGMGFRADSRKA